jgi:hypothetical protein
MAGRRSLLSRRLLGVALSAVLGLQLAGQAPMRLDAAVSVQGVQPVGTIPAGGCGDGSLLVDQGLGLLLRVEETYVGTGGCAIGTPDVVTLVAYSTSSLRQVARATLAIPNGRTIGYLGGRPLPVVDGVRHRLLLVAADPVGDDLDVYDLHQLLGGATTMRPSSIASIPISPPPGTLATDNPGGQDTHVLPDGLSYDALSNTVQILLYTNSPLSAPGSIHGIAAADVYVLQLDGVSLAQQWWEELGQCAFPFSLGGGGGFPGSEPVMRVHQPGVGDSIIAGCMYVRGPTKVLPGNTTAGSSLTYVLGLDNAGRPAGSASYYIGAPNGDFGVADPADSRMFYPTEAGFQQAGGSTAQAPAALAFDVPHGMYVGDVTVSVPSAQRGGSTAGYRLVAAGGRLYAAGPGGLIVTASGDTPLGQGSSYPVFNCFANGIVADPATRRVFIEAQSDCMASSPQTQSAPGPIVVLQDNTSISPATSVDPDSYTSGAPESGQTAAQYQGHAAGTAVRAQLVGGSAGLISGATLGLLDAAIAQGPVVVPSDTATHETTTATVMSGDLDNFQSSASAVSAAADTNTKGQLAPTGQSWPFQEAACSASSVKSGPVTQDYQGDSATVTCDPAAGATTARAEAGPLSFTTTTGFPMLTGSGETQTSTVRDSAQGMVITVTSSAHGVVAGPVEIQAITATVVCRAHGRRGTASCTYTRSISGITNGGVPVAGGSCNGAGSDPCPQVVAALNAIFPGLLVFSTPSPDQRLDYVGGSPGGYQSVAQRELYEHLQDQTLNYDASLQVPALQALYINDSPTTRSRLDMQWASVQAEGHYGIQPATSASSNGGGLTSPGETQPSGSGAGGAGGTGAASGTAITGATAPSFAGPTGTTVIQALQRIWDGLRALWRSPVMGLLVLSLLGTLGTPLIMAWRRRVLLVALSRSSA